MSTVSELHQAKLAKHNKATFTIIERKVECSRSFQFYIDTGSTKDGPWVRIGINDTEYIAGFTTKRIEAGSGKSKEESIQAESIQEEDLA